MDHIRESVNCKDIKHNVICDCNISDIKEKGASFGICHSNDIKVEATCDCINESNEKGASFGLDNVSCNITDRSQEGTIYSSDNIKKEGFSSTTDRIRENVISMKVEDTCDCINDMKETGASFGLDNVSCNVIEMSQEGTIYSSDNIKQELLVPSIDNIGESCTGVCNDIKEDRNIYSDDVNVEGIYSIHEDIEQPDHDEEAKVPEDTHGKTNVSDKLVKT